MRELIGTTVSLGEKENYPCHTWNPSLQLPAPLPPPTCVPMYLLQQSQSITAEGEMGKAPFFLTPCVVQRMMLSFHHPPPPPEAVAQLETAA